MAQIKVKIINSTTLELLEDAKKGDIISLNEIMEVDSSFINELILKSKDNEIETRAKQESNKQLEIFKANYETKLLENEKKIKAELEKDYKTKEDNFNLEKDRLNQIIQSNQITINNLNNEIKNLKDDIQTKIKLSNQELEIKHNNETIKLKENFAKEKESLKEKYNEINSKYNALSLQKSSLNVKQLGEELENWCNNEFQQASIAGFINCTWEKDNTVVKLDDQTKGSKADYIFKVYLNNEYKEENMLASVCLEMKNESNVSTNKKKNSDYYSKLDENRRKKNCEYALLVSELEYTSSNDCPIQKINGYEKMYMVRPQYMISFLSLIYSLANKYKQAILNRKQDEYNFKAKKELEEEFENLKQTYLDKPLIALEKNVESLSKNNAEILKFATKNSELLTEITNKTIKSIKDKIERFNIRKISKNLED